MKQSDRSPREKGNADAWKWSWFLFGWRIFWDGPPLRRPCFHFHPAFPTRTSVVGFPEMKLQNNEERGLRETLWRHGESSDSLSVKLVTGTWMNSQPSRSLYKIGIIVSHACGCCEDWEECREKGVYTIAWNVIMSWGISPSTASHRNLIQTTMKGGVGLVWLSTTKHHCEGGFSAELQAGLGWWR